MKPDFVSPMTMCKTAWRFASDDLSPAFSRRSFSVSPPTFPLTTALVPLLRLLPPSSLYPPPFPPLSLSPPA